MARPAISPASYAAKPEADGLVRRSMPDPSLTWTVHFVTRAEAGHTAKLFADMLVAADLVNDLRVGISGDEYVRNGQATAIS
ncbi:type 2 periplasmic-binding domain-containing protein [Streptomyces odonnellii]|uniref:hypothetical protein n=1 Tax=Streptomyces odonnellii TaxID=1417980 RepID=UPI000625F721|nr:hypothetical protein [Streptomyces odonnellii]